MKQLKLPVLAAVALAAGALSLFPSCGGNGEEVGYGRFSVAVKMYIDTNRIAGEPWQPVNSDIWQVPDIYYLDEYCLETSIQYRGTTHLTIGSPEVKKELRKDTVYYLINTRTDSCAVFQHSATQTMLQKVCRLDEKTDGLNAGKRDSVLDFTTLTTIADSSLGGRLYRRSAVTGANGNTLSKKVTFYWNDSLKGFPDVTENLWTGSHSLSMLQVITIEFFRENGSGRIMKDSTVLRLEPRPGDISRERLAELQKLIAQSGI